MAHFPIKNWPVRLYQELSSYLYSSCCCCCWGNLVKKSRRLRRLRLDIINTASLDLTWGIRRPTAVWRCLANGQVAAQACVCRLWAVAWLAGGSGQWWERIRGGLTANLTAYATIRYINRRSFFSLYMWIFPGGFLSFLDSALFCFKYTFWLDSTLI